MDIGFPDNKLPPKDACAARSLVPVWDLGVRLFHWSLFTSVAVCAYTGFLGPKNWLGVHLASGAVIAGLIVFRIVWGLTGTTYARFRSFPLSISAMLKHFRDAAEGRAQADTGHNPAGAAMVYALLAVVGLVLLTGLVALGGALKQGPLAFATTFSVGNQAREVHEWFAIGLLALVAVHLLGDAFESWRTNENLTRSMITGRKTGKMSGDLPAVKGHPWLAAVAMAGIAWLVIPAGVRLSSFPAFGVPTGPIDPVYASECGRCHFAYPASLMTAPVWISVMDGLANHFGDNAALDAATTIKIREWLVANSSEHWDTLAANRFRRMDPAEPLRITASPAWVHFHHGLPATVFVSKSVGSKVACNACHRDAATGRFDPQEIAVPR
jgi:cytochrome b